MAIFNYIKVEPTTYLAEYRRGSLKREGSGLSFWYFAPVTTLVAIPLETIELPFIFKERVLPRYFSKPDKVNTNYIVPFQDECQIRSELLHLKRV